MEGADGADEPSDRGPLSDAASVWSGATYERVAETFAPIHDRVVEALAISPGERVLDIGTGTGAVAVRAARAGADVVGVDISADQLSKARAAADEAGLEVELIECDCQDLPFPAAQFDAVASVFGFVFAPDHARAGSEVARVSKPGARLALTSWTYDEFSTIGERLGRDTMPGEDAREWSNEDHARDRLSSFDLSIERGSWVVEQESAEALWDLLRTSVPPLKVWLDGLSDDDRERAKRAYSAAFPDGVLQREYVLMLGTRR